MNSSLSNEIQYHTANSYGINTHGVPATALVLLLLFVAGLPAAADELPPAAEDFDFQRDIRPLLESRCTSCHGSQKQQGGLRLDTWGQLSAGGDSGPAFERGNSGKSDLIHRIARLDEDLAMPPDASDALSAQQVSRMRAWIDAGAPWPEGFMIRSFLPQKLSEEDLASLPLPSKKKVDFVLDVQPIFERACYQCHGPERHESNLRLDHKPTLFLGGSLGPPIEKGNSAQSLLIHFIAGLRPEGRMPMSGEPLSDREIGVLRAWIDQGASFPDSASVELKDTSSHWAFHAPVKSPLPENGEAQPIDAFVKARHEKENLTFSPEADPRTLLRRLHLDLTGLPPTLEEQKAFLADASGDPLLKAADRLLQSPHYGERWGRHWLDAARYADSDGYEKDKPRIAHFYRNWVINAFNRDLPYDRFIIEQIAGDLLPNPTQDQIVATGYLRNSMLNEEGAVDPEQFRMEAMFDRMDAIGKGILALGLNCVQCHNHKYDPISQEEYYRLFAFLNNDHEAQPRVYSQAELARIQTLQDKIADIENRLRENTPGWQRKLEQWEKTWHSESRPAWRIIRPRVEKDANGGARYLPQPDGSFLAAGYQPTKAVGTFALTSPLKDVTGFRLEMMHDPNLPANGPGRSFMGTFGLSEFQVEIHDSNGKRHNIKFAEASADVAPPENTPVHPRFNEKKPKKRFIGPAAYAIDGNNDTGWSSDLGPGRHNMECTAVFATGQPVSAETATLRLVQRLGGWNAADLHANQMGRFRLSVTSDPHPRADRVPVRVRNVLQVAKESRTQQQNDLVFSYWRTIAGEHWPELAERYSAANRKIEALWKSHPEGTTQFTLQKRMKGRVTNILRRGDWLKPAGTVSPGVPRILHDLPADAGSNRLTFARWLVAPESPTTARAIVNRVWQAYFGTGIVSTSHDFGTQGEDPVHPQLLDWLAVDFMENGWSLKYLHRQIISSRTYRQSSQVTPQQFDRDPDNRLLARGPRFRLEGEVIRDVQLAVSGLLNPTIGGQAVMPPAPQSLFLPPASYAPFPWIEETGANRYRRAVYTWRRRTTPYPFLQTFDTPVGNVACIRRTRANTPIQALVALNETVSVEAARAFARRILKEGGDSDQSRLNYAFQLSVARPVTDGESDVLLEIMNRQRQRVDANDLNAHDVARISEESEFAPRDLAAWTLTARVLLNLDETITKE